jgi:glycosyltransferase involved in cell wall biosynthesis
MDKPLVTVVIPCHNYAEYVTDAIRSVQAQTLNNLECWIVCDACDDNSYDVASQATRGDARFHVVMALNRSLSATRNMGIALGSAPFLCCLDADDEMGSEEYLEILVSELEKDRTLGIAFSSIQVMDAKGVLGHVPNWPNGWDFEQQCKHVNQIPSLCVFRRDMWQRAGGFRPYYRYVEDAEFWTTCGMIGFSAVHATTQPWFHYRLHNKSASQVHRTGEIPEPDWLEWHPGARDNQRPFAACGNPPRGSWPVRFYHEPDVSIIIPVGKGHEEIVKDALHSVEGQTHRMWECIVVDDTWGRFGSRLDLTSFPWAKVYSTGKVRGAGAARNVGLKHAHAPYVVFLDADDMLKPDFLAATLAAYKQHGRYAYTDWLTHERMTNWQVHTTPEYSFEALRDKPSLHPVTALIPRRWALNVGGFDETLPAFEDVDFYMRLFTKGYCGVRVAQPLLIYNLDTGHRRADSENFRPKFHELLKKRYGKFMEDNTMCDCITPPKGKQPAAPSAENAAEYREAYGEIILARLMGRFTPEAPAEFRGPATRVSYGRRAKGDVFYIWQADLENSGDVFERVENFTTEPEPTIVPPAPSELSTPEKIVGDVFAYDAPPVVLDEPENEHQTTVGERNDTLPPEQSEGLSFDELQAQKKAERNVKDRERRAAKKTAKK